MQALKESKKTNRRQSGTGGSSEGTIRIPAVPDKSTVVFATSSDGTGTKLRVLDKEKVTSEANVILKWGSENESEHSEDSQLNYDKEEKKDNDGDAADDDEDDDHIIDIQDTDDEDAKTESDKDEISLSLKTIRQCYYVIFYEHDIPKWELLGYAHVIWIFMRLGIREPTGVTHGKIGNQKVKGKKGKKVNEESKEEESTRKRKLSTRKKMKSRKRRYIQNTYEDDSDKENDELRLHLTIAPDEEKEVD
ncbi:hypothetical protein Tco_1576810 [Tanacetum coccineum]